MKWGLRDSSRNPTCINAKKCPGNRQSIEPDESEEFQKIQFGTEATPPLVRPKFWQSA